MDVTGIGIIISVFLLVLAVVLAIFWFWLKRWQKGLDERLKKNLEELYKVKQ